MPRVIIDLSGRMGSNSAATTQLLLLWLCVKGAFANSCQSPIQRVPFLQVQAPVKTKLASFHVPTGSLLQNPDVSFLHGGFGKGATVALPRRASDWTMCLSFLLRIPRKKTTSSSVMSSTTHSLRQGQPFSSSLLSTPLWPFRPGLASAVSPIKC